MHAVVAIRARRGILLTDVSPVRGKELYAPLDAADVVDDMLLVCEALAGAAADVDGAEAASIVASAALSSIASDSIASGLISTGAAVCARCNGTSPFETTPADTTPADAVIAAQDLLAPVAALMAGRGRIRYAGKYHPRHIPPGAVCYDAGDVALAPAAVNAHCHLQLAHVAGKVRLREGFAPWLASLIPLLFTPMDAQAVEALVAAMVRGGTAHVGDFTGAGIALVAQALRTYGVGGTLFAEWFGFAPTAGEVWPPAVREALAQHPWLAELATTDPAARPDAGSHMLRGASSAGSCGAFAAPLTATAPLRMAPAGHALYSTAADTVQAAQRWCVAHKRPFSLHLAESPEENDALLHGTGGLVDIYKARVLPPHWRAPEELPVAYAARLGLLGPYTLAVHGVQCNAADIERLAESGTALALCPRSNALLAVGCAPYTALAEAGVLLCVGTDGVSSNTDCNVWREGRALLEALPPQAVLRMLCVNGWHALHVPAPGGLRTGAPAHWAVILSEYA